MYYCDIAWPRCRAQNARDSRTRKCEKIIDVCVESTGVVREHNQQMSPVYRKLLRAPSLKFHSHVFFRDRL